MEGVPIMEAFGSRLTFWGKRNKMCNLGEAFDALQKISETTKCIVEDLQNGGRWARDLFALGIP